MPHAHVPNEIPVRYLPRSRRASSVAAVLFVVGLASFVTELVRDPTTAWVSYVSNWLFFMSISAGGVILACAAWITKSKWNWSLRRVSQAQAAFLPIAFVLLLPMLSLRSNFFPWITQMGGDPEIRAKAVWLNIPFLITRNVVGMALLVGLTVYFVYLAVRPDMGLTRGTLEDDPGRMGWRTRLTQGWLGQEQEEVDSYHRMTRIAPALVLLYVVVLTMISYDWVMSLEPHWRSSMLAPWFWMGAFWGGGAATAIWSMYLRTKHKDFQHAIGLQQRHDLGKFAFAFSVFWTYLFFSQYLVIWYGKLPWEQSWIIHRSVPPWGWLSLLVVILCFVVPVAGLLGRKPKMKPKLLTTFTTIILLGLWLEAYDMVAPALHKMGQPAFPVWHPLIALMFLGLWMGSIRWFLSTFPAIQIWQPMVDPETVDAERPEGAYTAH